MKKAIYWIVLVLPIFALAIVFLFTARDMYFFRRTSPQEIYQKVRTYSSRPASFPMPNSIYEFKKNRKLVYVFGESSLVISDGNTFPNYLEQMSDKLQVVNLGVNGINSTTIQQRVAEALDIASPDLVILYFGHNDYNNVYQGLIMPRYFDTFHFLLWPSYLINIGSNNPGVLQQDEYYWYSRLTRPKLIKLFEQLRLIEIKQGQYEQINGYILDKYIANTTSMICQISSKGIPIVIVTPIANLRAEPFGDIDTTTKYYEKGMNNSRYSESIELLKAARDKEIFTYDLRAKSPLVDYVANMHIPNVYVLDLEKHLEANQFEFGYSCFLDYFHFNDRTHRIVADTIYQFIIENRLIDTR